MGFSNATSGRKCCNSGRVVWLFVLSIQSKIEMSYRENIPTHNLNLQYVTFVKYLHLFGKIVFLPIEG